MFEQQSIDCTIVDSSINKIKLKSVELPHFPTTRYQGSKRKILSELATALSSIDYTKALDMFSGSGVVSLLFRFLGKNVSSNDFLSYNQNTAKVFLNFDLEKLNSLDIKKDLENLLYHLPTPNDCLVKNNYSGIYFLDSENNEIDRFCQNIHSFDDFQKTVYTYAVGQALLKKRPYNLFHRAKEGANKWIAPSS